MAVPEPQPAPASARYAPRGPWTRLRRHPAGNVAIVFSAFLIACIIASLAMPDDFRFLSSANIRILLRAIAPIGIMALGVGILMIAGEFDLSIAATFTLAPYMMVLAWGAGAPEVVAVGVALGTAAIVGLVNGAITLGFGIPSFITTLGMLFMIRSGSRLITDMKPLNFSGAETWFIKGLAGKIGVVPMQFLWFLGFAVIAHVLLNHHRLGNHFLAVGGNRAAATATGIDVARTKMIAFVLCSICASLAGILSIARQKSATVEPQLFLELEAIAMVVIGGVIITGGRGAVLGIVLGACILQMVKDVLFLGRAPGYYLDLFVGVVIVVAVVLNMFAAKRY